MEHNPTHNRHIPKSHLSPREREKLKTDKEKLDELSYLIIHTIACFLTDAPSILVQSWAQNHIGFSHENDKLSFHINLKNKPNLVGGDEPRNLLDAFRHQFAHLGEWAFGECVGDLVAIPATVVMQRHLPEVMDVIQKPLEAVAGVFYKDASEKAAKHWAQKHDISEYSKEYHDFRRAHYEEEIQKLPQAFMWTVISMVVGAVAQKELAPRINPDWGNDGSYAAIIQASILGKIITGVTANAPRMLAPEFTHKTDHAIRHSIAEPATRLIESITGHGRITASEADVAMTLK